MTPCRMSGGGREQMRLKVLDGPGAALERSRTSGYTEVVRYHFWLLYAKWEGLEGTQAVVQTGAH